jgi:cell division inhibitor SepF
MEVCVIKPTYYESTRDIIDTLLEGKSVILNLEGMKLDLAQRIVDSVSGGCYAIHGNLQKISAYIYLVTPSTVDISGDFQELVNSESSDFSGSYSRRNY